MNQELLTKPYEDLTPEEKLEIKSEAETITNNIKNNPMSSDMYFIGATSIVTNTDSTIPEGHIDIGDDSFDEYFDIIEMSSFSASRFLKCPITNTTDNPIIVWAVPFKRIKALEAVSFSGDEHLVIEFIKKNPKLIYLPTLKHNTAHNTFNIQYMTIRGVPYKTNRFLAWLNIYNPNKPKNLWIKKRLIKLAYNPMIKYHKNTICPNEKKLYSRLQKLSDQHTEDMV